MKTLGDLLYDLGMRFGFEMIITATSYIVEDFYELSPHDRQYISNAVNDIICENNIDVEFKSTKYDWILILS